MTRRLLFLSVIVVGVAALAGTISYAAARATNGGHYGSMMNGSGYTMMGSNTHRMGWYLDGNGPVTTIAAARDRAQQFADRLELKASEVIQFSDNFYVRLDDKNGQPATEVLVDPQSGAVTLEYGPAMMWNTRYGMMRAGTAGQRGMMDGGGMMGGRSGGMMGDGSNGGMMNTGHGGMMSGVMGRYGTHPSWKPSGIHGPVSVSQAHDLAQRWLDANQPSLQVESGGDSFPGYYTLETLENGKVGGMISVNKASGAVWYHWWHGHFVAMEG